MTTHRPLDDADILLIQRVKSTPSLYDPRNGDFRLSQRKQQDWEKVASSLNINILDARRRWTCLRDRYSRELKQIRLHPNRSDYGRNDFFRQMDFLREFVRKRRERSRRDDSSGNNSSWSKSKLSVNKNDSSAHSEPEADDETEETQIYEDSVHNYDTKLAVHASTTSAEAYSMIVEETHEPYEHYHVQPGTPGSSSDTKQISLTPVMLQQQNVGANKPSSGSLTPQLQTGVQQHQQAQHQPQQQQQQQQQQHQVSFDNVASETEDDYFCKSVAAYLRQLSRRHKIKAKVEIYQILEKYIELEECASTATATQKG